MRKTSRISSSLSGGFTLVEIAVVLTVVALVIGTILTGKTLLESVAIQRTISQVKEVQVAVGLFRERYGYWPGDFKKANTIWPSKSALNGNGDGKITGGYDGSNGNALSTPSECYNAWHHLYLSGFYPAYFAAVSVPSGKVNNYSPKLALDRAYITIRNETLLPSNIVDKAYFMITGISHCMKAAGLEALLLGTPPVVMNETPTPTLFSWLIADAWAAPAGSEVGIAPKLAYNIDKKIDDGFPFSGLVQSPLAELSDTTKNCNLPNSKYEYYLSSDRLVCGLWIDPGI